MYQAEKQMGELGDKVDADAKAKVEEKRTKLKEATEKEDYDAMKTLLEELQQELYTVGASFTNRPVRKPALHLVAMLVPEPMQPADHQMLVMM